MIDVLFLLFAILFILISFVLITMSFYIFHEHEIKTGMEWTVFDTAGLRSALRNWDKSKKGRILMYFGLLSAAIPVILFLSKFRS